MKYWIFVIFLLCPLAAGAETKWVLSSGLRYDMFTDDRAPQTIGYELTIPLGVTWTWGRLVLAGDAAFGSANVFPGTGADANLTGLTDTRLSASYMLLAQPVGVLLGVDADLPTGHARLSNTQQAAEAGENHDLFEIDDFGAGFNLGASLGLAKVITEKLRLSVNGAYRLNGAYDPTADMPDDELDPGDETRLLGKAEWQAASWLRVTSSAAYTHFTPDRRNGQESFQEGAKFALGGAFQLTPQFAQAVSIACGLQYAGQAKNKEQGLDGLRPEPENSNGPQFFGSLDVVYKPSQQVAFRLLGDLRHYGASARRDAEKGVPQEGERLRLAFGPGVIYGPNSKLALNMLAKYFILRQEQDLLNDRATTFRGVNLSLFMTYSF